MAELVERGGRDEFILRRLTKPEEFRAAEELSAASAGPRSPATFLRAAQDNGGIVLGAFADVHLAGASAAFLGWDGTTLYLYAHLTVVRPEYRNHHVGRRLLLRLREELLEAGLGEIRWLADPLESPAALLGVRRLGGVPDRYLIHHFGRPTDTDGATEETDRVRTVWRLSDPKVEARLKDGAPSREADESRWKASEAILESETGEHGLRQPKAVNEPTSPSVHLEIPFDLALLREHEPRAVRSWRHATRDAFRAAFDLGYVVEDFAVISADHERRSFYLLRSPKAG